MSRENHTIDKQIDTVLKILYALKDDGKFYFFTYGRDHLKTLIKEAKKKS